MALKGDLRNFSTTQLLNLINLAKKTGVLTIYEGIPTGEKDALGDPKFKPGKDLASVFFRQGKLIHARQEDQDGNLASVLHKAGKLNDRQTTVIRERASSTSDKALALLLIQANYVTQADIVTSIRQHVLDVIYDLLTWNEGPFSFDDETQPPEDRITVPIELENVIIEGSRRMKEVERLTDELPNLDFALRFPEDPGRQVQRHSSQRRRMARGLICKSQEFHSPDCQSQQHERYGDPQDCLWAASGRIGGAGEAAGHE